MKSRNPLLLFLAGQLLFISILAVRSADWPTWRYNAGRTAASPEQLPLDLQPIWSREFLPPNAAWPETQRKLQFDASYEPVVMGNLVYVPSMVADRVTALDLNTGREVWRFYTEAPVRFAPVAYHDKVAFVADDGHIYCLKASDGTLVWKFRGGPSDRRVLGNERLVSMWPARGGPVLYENTLYFAASIWPSMGIFIYALDPETGKVIWVNSGSGSNYITQQHDSPAFAGVSPQGYLTVSGNQLLVAGGRSVPAAFDRFTGKFLFYEPSSRKFGKDVGGHGSMAMGDWFFNGNVLHRISDGADLARARTDVLTPDVAYGLEGDSLVAFRLPPTSSQVKDRRGRTRQQWAMNKKWEISLGDHSPEKIHLRAGHRLYGTREDGTLMSIDLPIDGTSPKVSAPSWSRKISGTPWSMVAARGKLLVMTKEGRLYCFGKRPPGITPHWYPVADKNLKASPGNWSAVTRNILEQTSLKKGYAIALGIGSGHLIDELIRQSDFHLIVLEPDKDKVNAFRRRLDSAGLYGTRAVVLTGNPFSLPLPPYLARLVVSEDLNALGPRALSSVNSSLWNVMRPYGGVAFLRDSSRSTDEISSWIRSSLSEEFTLQQEGEFLRLQRPGALPGSAPWTHQYGDAANSVVSRDTRVKTPLGLLWFGGPSNDEVLPRHGHGPSPQVVGGRLFIEGPDMLRAVDVYTGQMLWQRELPGIGTYYNNTAHQPGANEIGANYVSMPDGVYVMSPTSCILLDPATGKTMREFELPAIPGRESPKWGYIKVYKDILLATASPIDLPSKDKSSEKNPTDSLATKLTQPDQWRYLAGKHPQGDWTDVRYDDSSWKTGTAGFGFGDDDDATELKDMQGKYTVVYLRQNFSVTNPDLFPDLDIGVLYDDAFVAYLNGEEILRQGIRSGSGPDVSRISSHEAEQFEFFKIKNARKLLRLGDNVLAIEGHNNTRSSSDFSIDPHLGILGKSNTSESAAPPTSLASLKPDNPFGINVNVDYASSSANLVAMNRHTGEVLWKRDAVYSFRHNTLTASRDMVFCIDMLTEEKKSQMERRGIKITAKPVLYALDSATGQIVWKDDTHVFGTWLGYSTKHDMLIQAGSDNRDRAKDEIKKGLAAFRGRDGQLLWEHHDPYKGPCMLHHETIITQGEAFDLLTGKQRLRKHPLTGEEIPWSFTRNYGCNTAIASEHLITFRSAAAGFFDLSNDSGTGNLGGFRSGCTANLIAADGVLNAPDYTHTCTCSYQNQSSLAWIHMPETDVELWTFNKLDAPEGRIRKLGINFGAPGDRQGEKNVLWLEYPVVGGPSPKLDIKVTPTSGNSANTFRHHPSIIQNEIMPWVSASGLENVSEVTVNLNPTEKSSKANAPGQPYSVRLVFAEPTTTAPGHRKFDVVIQGKTVLKNFDVAKIAGGPHRATVHQFDNLRVDQSLSIKLIPAPGSQAGPLLCGLEILSQE